MVATRGLHCMFLAALLAVMTLLMPLTSAAAPMTEPPYYSYAKSKLKGLRSQWKDLLAAGTRVLVMLSEDIPYAPGARAATAKIHKTNAADWTPVWHSDRVPHEYDDLHTWIGEIGDVLVIDKDGKVEGGEVTELLKTLLPAVAKRPTPMTGIHQVGS